MSPGRPSQSGFTLTELAIALLIIGLLLGGVVITLESQIAARNQAETRRTLDLAAEALIGFAVARGRLPCPATDTSLGAEVMTMVGMPGTPAISFEEWGSCALTDGFLPSATLGITPVDSQGYAIDAWGSNTGGLYRIRYAVDARTTVTVQNDAGGPAVTVFAFTGRNALKKSGFVATPDIRVCAVAPIAAGSTVCDVNVVSVRVPAVIYSLGPNGATAAGQTQALFEASAASADERENYNTNPRIFVARPALTIAGDTFDDIVTYLSPNVLFNRLVAANPL